MPSSLLIDTFQSSGIEKHAMPTPAKLIPDALRAWTVAAHGSDFTSALAARFGVSRVAAAGAVRQLEAEAFVQRLRTGTRPLSVAGLSRLVVLALPLPGVDESLLWTERIRRWLGDLPEPVDNLSHYGFTEMVNNANAHAGAPACNFAARPRRTPYTCGSAMTVWVSSSGFERPSNCPLCGWRCWS